MSKSGIPIVSDVAKLVKPVVKAIRPLAPILPFIPIPGMFGLSSLLTKSLLTGALGGVDKQGKFDLGRGLKSGLLAYGVGSLMNPATATAGTGAGGTGIEGFGAAADEVGGALSGATAGSSVGGGIPLGATSDVGISSLGGTPQLSGSAGDFYGLDSAPAVSSGVNAATAPPYEYIDSSTVVPPASVSSAGAAPIEYPREVIPGAGANRPTASALGGIADLGAEALATVGEAALKNPIKTALLGTTAYGAIKTKEELERQREEAERVLANQEKEKADRIAQAKQFLTDYPLLYRRITAGDVETMKLAGGGLAGLTALAGGGQPRYLSGGGDGMSDSIPARIGGKQEARLADGEFVVPADVVSHIGNGSSNAGAKKLYAMMDRARQARTGKKRQAPEINARRVMPV